MNEVKSRESLHTYERLPPYRSRSTVSLGLSFSHSMQADSKNLPDACIPSLTPSPVDKPAKGGGRRYDVTFKRRRTEQGGNDKLNNSSAIAFPTRVKLLLLLEG